MGPLKVDMFASCLTHQLPRYFNWKPDPAAEATDAFIQDWSPFSWVCKPFLAMVPPPAYTCKDSMGESQSGHSSSSMGDTTMVPSPSTTTVQISTSGSIATGYSDLTNSGEIHNSGRGTTISHLAIIRDQSRSGGLSEGASHLLYSPDATSHSRVRVRDLVREPPCKHLHSRSRVLNGSRASTRNNPRVPALEHLLASHCATPYSSVTLRQIIQTN